jgi:hypothetical protein
MPLSVPEIDEEFTAALADAGIERTATRLYLANEMGQKHIGAVWFPPGDELYEDEQFPDESQLDDANSAAHRNLHRIVAPAKPDDKAMLAALLRHELEHARHYDALGTTITQLQDFIEHGVLPYAAGGLDGCAGGLVNTIPTEVDCNAAASVYIAGRFSPDEVQRIRDGDRRALACSLLPPDPPETLPARMLAFAFIYRGAVIAYAAQQGSEVGEVIDGYFGDGAAETWARLEAGMG